MKTTGIHVLIAEDDAAHAGARFTPGLGPDCIHGSGESSADTFNQPTVKEMKANRHEG